MTVEPGFGDVIRIIQPQRHDLGRPRHRRQEPNAVEGVGYMRLRDRPAQLVLPFRPARDQVQSVAAGIAIRRAERHDVVAIHQTDLGWTLVNRKPRQSHGALLPCVQQLGLTPRKLSSVRLNSSLCST